jgi:hypothetical protein
VLAGQRTPLFFLWCLDRWAVCGFPLRASTSSGEVRIHKFAHVIRVPLQCIEPLYTVSSETNCRLSYHCWSIQKSLLAALPALPGGVLGPGHDGTMSRALPSSGKHRAHHGTGEHGSRIDPAVASFDLAFLALVATS